MNKYDILLTSERFRAPSRRAEGVEGYRHALDQRRFRLLQWRARNCNIAIDHGGVLDTSDCSQCTLCTCFCRTILERVQ